MKLRLKIVKGSGEGKSFVFTKAPVRIGRAPESDLVLNDDGISRLQCELLVEPAGVMLRDLTSANGTKVNDVIATETELKVGDSIGMGPVIFEVLEIDAHAEIRASGIQAAKADRVVPKPMGEGDPGTKPSAPPQKRSELVTKVAGKLTGIFKSHQVVQSPRAQSSQRRIVRLAALTALVIAVCTAYYIAKHRKPDESFRVFPIDKTALATSYGKGNVDVVASDRATFTFDSQGGRVVIAYAAASIDRGDQVEIVVNGERVGYAPQTASGWTTGFRINVPRRLLKAERNIVIFDNLDIPARAGKEDDRWAIGQVTVTETVLPAPDTAKAKQLHDLGKVAFDSRSVAPQNLTRALAYLEEAELFTAAEASPSPVAQDIEKLLTKVRAELQTTFEAHIFSAEQALRFGDTERARDALRDILRYFPDANDPRHQAAKERLAELGIGSAH
ncbi:MAG: FHA domain-containing protein [Myxococcota bacterium]